MSGTDWQSVYARLQAVQRALESGAERSPAERDRILSRRAAAVREARRGEAERSTELELIEFAIGKERYALASAKVCEVVPFAPPAPLPASPPFLLGLVNVRGRILAVLDLRLLLGLSAPDPSGTGKLIVLEDGEHTDLAVLADTVAGLTRIPETSLQPPLPNLHGQRPDYMLGIGPDRLIVLDAGKLATDPALTAPATRAAARAEIAQKENP